MSGAIYLFWQVQMDILGHFDKDCTKNYFQLWFSFVFKAIYTYFLMEVPKWQTEEIWLNWWQCEAW